MLQLIRNHWAALLSIIPLLPSLWRWVVNLFDWGARVDLIVTKLHEAGGMSGVLAFLLDPPAWLIWPAIAVAALLLLWDSRRQKETMASGTLPQATSTRLALAFRSPNGRPRGWIGLVLLCAIFGVGYWYISSITGAKREVITAAIPIPPPAEAPSAFPDTPIVIPPVATPTSLPPLPSIPTQSRLNRFIFACDAPIPATSEEAIKHKKELQDNITAWAETIGMNVAFPDVRNGTQATIEAKSNEAKARFISMGMFPGITKVIFEVRVIERRQVVVVRADVPKNLRILETAIPDSSAPQIIDGQNLIARFFGIPEGACRLI